MRLLIIVSFVNVQETENCDLFLNSPVLFMLYGMILDVLMVCGGFGASGFGASYKCIVVASWGFLFNLESWDFVVLLYYL